MTPQRFNKAHVAGLIAGLSSLVSFFLPNAPPEAVAGLAAFVAWVVTYLIPNRG